MGSLASDSRPNRSNPASTWSTPTLSRRSATSTTGMARASSTSSSSETSCTPWATTPPRRSASASARPTRRAKFAKFDDVVSKVEEALKTPDSQGTYADYVELLKLYDKNQNGTMMLAELDNILCNLGDEIPKEDVQKMFAELCDPEDEDGLFPYMSFLDRLTGKA